MAPAFQKVERGDDPPAHAPPPLSRRPGRGVEMSVSVSACGLDGVIDLIAFVLPASWASKPAQKGQMHTPHGNADGPLFSRAVTDISYAYGRILKKRHLPNYTAAAAVEAGHGRAPIPSPSSPVKCTLMDMEQSGCSGRVSPIKMGYGCPACASLACLLSMAILPSQLLSRKPQYPTRRANKSTTGNCYESNQ
ncbi:unnamed protein product [Clonostachys rhizophaga]|uniref:Uncharacterized protein n=1 Tax=Clonostachys rhizophaga TaxID=160324 RepID=A0A9N9V9L4_9HYPO|nr:unnamed protein product [Clonostachys rhizophaga]